MKYRLLALALAVAVLLSGCTAILERSYSSSTTHVDYSVVEDSSILQAESYSTLVNSILYLVGIHAGTGTIRLYNYSTSPDSDLARARTAVMTGDPTGAYAVSDITFEYSRILTYYEVKLHITYRHTAAEVEAIRPVSGQTGVCQALEGIVTGTLKGSTLHTSYFTGDAELVTDLFWLAFYNDPTAALSAPKLTVTFYPENSSQRILEVKVDWPVTSKELEQYRRDLETAAAALLEGGDSHTVEQLAGILRSRVLYDPSGSHTALAALQGEAANDLGLLLAMEYLCLQSGIEASVVSDTAGAQMWLIVSTPSGYRHLLPRDLRPDGETPDGDWSLSLYTDEELALLGFVWPTELHPACVDYSGSVAE